MSEVGWLLDGGGRGKGEGEVQKGFRLCRDDLYSWYCNAFIHSVRHLVMRVVSVCIHASILLGGEISQRKERRNHVLAPLTFPFTVMKPLTSILHGPQPAVSVRR